MKSVLIAIITIYATAFFMSCQKEFLDPEAVGTVVAPTHDSVTFLSKMAIMKNRSGNDTAGLYEYIFDSLHRVTSINYYDHRDGSPGLESIIRYFYNDSSLAFKRTETRIDQSYTTTTYYFYNADKSLSKDSLIFPGGIQVNIFGYTSASITDTGRIYYNSDPTTAVLYVAKGFLDNSLNVVHTITAGDNIDQVENTFVYNNYSNPIAQLNISSTFNPIPGYNFCIYYNYLIKTNISLSTQEEVIAQGPRVSTTYSYIYNLSDMPVSVVLNTDYGIIKEPRILFEYKRI